MPCACCRVCSGQDLNLRTVPVDKVALPLSYPSKARIARRVRVAVFPAVCQGADSPHPRSGVLGRVRRLLYRGGPLRAVIVCPGQHDRLQDQTGLT